MEGSGFKLRPNLSPVSLVSAPSLHLKEPLLVFELLADVYRPFKNHCQYFRKVVLRIYFPLIPKSFRLHRRSTIIATSVAAEGLKAAPIYQVTSGAIIPFESLDLSSELQTSTIIQWSPRMIEHAHFSLSYTFSLTNRLFFVRIDGFISSGLILVAFIFPDSRRELL